MSYILDALRRADAERESGGVPGLHTQQYGALPDADDPERPRLLIGVIGVLALALAGALAWQFFGGERAALRAQGPVTLVPAPAPAPTPAPASASASASASALVATASTPTAMPAASSAKAPTGEAPAAAPAAAKAPRVTPTPKERRAPPSKSAVEPPAKPAGEERLYTQAELPEAVRRDLPRLTVGGASYSKDAASRMVILNGQVFHEGDKIAPGLVLQTIKLKSAILAYKGYRYELSY